jgi:hypothetical protein
MRDSSFVYFFALLHRRINYYTMFKTKNYTCEKQAEPRITHYNHATIILTLSFMTFHCEVQCEIFMISTLVRAIIPREDAYLIATIYGFQIHKTMIIRSNNTIITYIQ